MMVLSKIEWENKVKQKCEQIYTEWVIEMIQDEQSKVSIKLKDKGWGLYKTVTPNITTLNTE